MDLTCSSADLFQVIRSEASPVVFVSLTIEVCQYAFAFLLEVPQSLEKLC